MTNAETGRITVLQEFATIITGLAFGTLIQQFVTMHSLNKGRLLVEIPFSEDLSLLAFLIVIVRFYHGNMFELNDLLDRMAVSPGAGISALRGTKLMGIWFVLLSQGALFGCLGLFVDRQMDQRLLLMVVFVIDLVYFFLLGAASTGTASTRHHTWATLSFASLLALSAIEFGRFHGLSPEVGDWVCGGGLIAASVIDYWKNWSFYF